MMNLSAAWLKCEEQIKPLKIISVFNNSELQGGYRFLGSHHVTFRKPIIKLIAFLLVFTFILTGCTADLNSINEMKDNDLQFEDGGRDIAMEKQREFSGFTKPPIDQNVPENLETVTLGMG